VAYRGKACSWWRALSSCKQNRVINSMMTHHSLEDDVRVRVLGLVDDPRAVNQVDALHQCDVLPHLGLPGNGGHLAHLHGVWNTFRKDREPTRRKGQTFR
jgi:hypothetical protein